MLFTLEGFEQVENIRHYHFDAVNDDRSRRQFVVGVDLDLIRRYRIPLQELPLLCMGVLERQTNLASTMFTERDMVQYADARAAAAESPKKGPRRSPAGKRGPNLVLPSKI